MSQEWDIDYRPPRNAPNRRFEQVVDHEAPKKKTAWRWYVGQMRGRGSWLYKTNLSALMFTLWGFVLGAIMLISFLTTWLFFKHFQ